MCGPAGRRTVLAAVAAGVLWVAVPTAGPSASAFKAAYYNIKGGVGEVALSAPSPFAATSNCTDPAKPLNAWGVDVVQTELRTRIASDPSIVVLGLAEAWACATPAAVQQVLGWPVRSGERNGTAAIARYGFAGPEQWLQLDTSRDPNPSETRWVLRVPVCLDAACSRSVTTFISHSSPGPLTLREIDRYTTADLHALQTLEFMAQLPAGQPHLLLGDLNVFEGTVLYCGGQPPVNPPLRMYRQAGYLDGWPVVHGSAEGFTAIWNRKSCGSPEGYLWKRIDFAWSKHLAPLTIQRFGMVAAGTAAPSDHAGLIVEYPHPDALAVHAPPTVSLTTPSAGATVAGTVSVTMAAADETGVRRVELVVNGQTVAVDATAPYSFSWDTRQVSNGPYTLQAAATDLTGHRVLSPARTITVKNVPAPGDEIVLHAIEATTVAGSWALVDDATAASRTRLQNANLGAAPVTTALSSPSSHVEFMFHAEAGRPYRLWIRGRALADSPDNDSVHVQFDRSVTASGSAIYRIGTTSATRISLEDCDGCGVGGWGWQDTSSSRDVLGPLISFSQSGSQRLRIQAREDGLAIDQIVLSSTLYRWRAPGAVLHDATLLPSSVTGTVPPGPSANAAPGVVLTAPANGTTLIAPATVAIAATAVDADGGVARVEFRAGGARLGIVSAPPYVLTWSAVPPGRYVLTAVAVDNEGAASTSAAVTLDVAADGSSLPALPAGWSSRDIGAASPAGSASGSAGVFTLKGAGADIWGTADAFHFAYQTLTGDGSITARVASLQAVDAWTKAGVMMRDTLTAGSPHAMMVVSPSKGLAFQRRVAAGGLSLSTAGGSAAAPHWVRLVRSGNTFSAFVSSGGSSWTFVGAETIPMAATIFVGLPLTSHRNGTLATASVDSVVVAGASTLPPGWSSRDVGAVSPAGSAGASGGVFTLKGAGADIWGTADAFHFAYQTLTGDGSITARVASLQAVDAWTKTGVMMRDTLTAGSPHAMMIVSPSKGLAFQRRVAPGGLSISTAGGSAAAPYLVRLVRSGNAFSAFVSGGGSGWTLVGTEIIPMGATIVVGLPLTSHKNGTLATASLDSVVVTSAPMLPAGWSSRDVGAVNPAGSASGSGAAFTVTGAGADIWGTSDAFHFAYRPLTGDGSVTARVATLDAIDAWTKAGVMMRETLDARSPHAMMLVSAAKGLAFQRRTATGGLSTHTASVAASAPYWVRLVRSGHTVSAYVSGTGTSWTLVGSETIVMAPAIYVGLPVTSHKDGTLAQVTFEAVSVTGP